VTHVRVGRASFRRWSDLEYGSAEMIAFFTTLRSFVVAVRRGLGDPQFRALAFLVVVLLGAGTLFYWRFEDWSLLDSLYFSVITLTTVGYGDLAPTTTPTKVFTIVYILIGLGVLVSFLSAVAGHAVEARMERKERRRPSGDPPES
jgi:ABC-type microcin C transport system permease subunit YejB